jgi:hypothetical protein
MEEKNNESLRITMTRRMVTKNPIFLSRWIIELLECDKKWPPRVVTERVVSEWCILDLRTGAAYPKPADPSLTSLYFQQEGLSKTREKCVKAILLLLLAFQKSLANFHTQVLLSLRWSCGPGWLQIYITAASRGAV